MCDFPYSGYAPSSNIIPRPKSRSIYPGISLTKASPLVGTGPTNVTPTRTDTPLTSGETAFSRTESVFLRPRSPVTTAKNVRMVTQGGANAYPSPVTFGVGQEDGWRGVRRTQVAELERKDRQALNLPDPAFDETKLLDRLQIAGDKLGREENEGAYESRENALAGTFHYLPSSHHQESSSGVPDRFHPGRESLSVVRNITIRDSKRTKTRTKDDDYKRRVFISSSIGTLAAGHNLVGPASFSHQHRLGQSSSALAGFGNSPSPRPISGGGGFHHETPGFANHRHSFEEGLSPVLPPGGVEVGEIQGQWREECHHQGRGNLKSPSAMRGIVFCIRYRNIYL